MSFPEFVMSSIHLNTHSSIMHCNIKLRILGVAPTMTGSTAEKNKSEQEEEIIKELVRGCSLIFHISTFQ